MKQANYGVHLRFLCSTTTILALAATSPAEIDVQLFAQPGVKNAFVEISVPVRSSEKSITFQLPRWRPGWYTLQDHAKRLINLEFHDGKGTQLKPTSPDSHTWSLIGPFSGKVKVRYLVPWEGSASVVSLSGPEAFPYVVGRKDEPIRLRVDVPKNWRVAVGLKGEGPTYRAANYDVLIDNPITIGDFLEDRYVVRGKTHVIALSGTERGAVDRAKQKKICQRITEIQAELFGGLPYEKYVWHFTAGPGQNWAGGLEHLSSTQIEHSPGLELPVQSVFSHEFFHLWNVKRIRTEALGPFDYTKLPKTGALWWLEGVTDYYADFLLRRGGLIDDAAYFTQVCYSVDAQRGNPKRLEVSPFDSSYRVDETDGGVGNSTGFGVSYYETGYLAGLCLDFAILEETRNQRSLDDVLLGLWKRCRDPRKPGFPEGAIREELVRVGGLKLGTLYDTWILKPGEFPVEEVLAQAGLELVSMVSLKVELGIGTTAVGNIQKVDRVFDEKSELKEGDEILLDAKQWASVLDPKLGSRKVDLPVRRSGAVSRIAVSLTVSEKRRSNIQARPNPTAGQLAHRAAWLQRPLRNRS